MTQDEATYLSNLHSTEYFGVLLCVMHVIEGWSDHFFTLILSYFKNKQATCNLLVVYIYHIYHIYLLIHMLLLIKIYHVYKLVLLLF